MSTYPKLLWCDAAKVDGSEDASPSCNALILARKYWASAERSLDEAIRVAIHEPKVSSCHSPTTTHNEISTEASRPRHARLCKSQIPSKRNAMYGYPSFESLVLQKVEALRCRPSSEDTFRGQQRKDLNVTSCPPPKISLSGQLTASINFPRVVPPDSDLATSIRSGNLDQIKTLLSTGQGSVADVIAPYGLTPLHLAAVHDQQEVCELLMEASALLHASKHNKTSSDILDCYRDHSFSNRTISVAQIVEDSRGLASSSPSMDTLWECRSWCSSIFEELPRLHKIVLGISSEQLENVASRYSVDELDGMGRTALHWATKFQRCSSMFGLLEFGADPNLGDAEGKTAMHIAASAGFCAGMSLLLSGGADIESRDRMGETPLYRAAMEGHVEALELLISVGADPGAHNYVGETPISRATYAQQGQAIQILRDNGCSVNNVDKAGFTHLLDAVFGDCHAILSAFPINEVDNAAVINDGRNLLHLATSNSSLRKFESLHDLRLNGLDTCVVDDAGFTPMDYLRRRLDYESVYEAFCALILGIAPIDDRSSIEDEFFDALEVIVDEECEIRG